MEQLTFFAGPVTNTVASPKGFERGMAASQKAADRRWTDEQQDQVDAAILEVASRAGRFTSEDVWKLLGDEFPVTKGMAARLLSHSRRGVIRNTGELSHASRGGAHDHGQRLTVWEAKR
jgi:hypothetical protein